MATTSNTYTGNGSTTNYSFTFEYLDQDDVKVKLDGVTTTAFTFANATTLSFNTAPANGVIIRIYRETNDTGLKATFFPGSAIKAEDLNDNFTQNLYVTQESRNEATTAVTTANTALSTAESAVADSVAAAAAYVTANTYTTTALDNGQLDTRYYTETELDAGQLDNRYYTESELNAGQLDNRYYTETEADSRFWNVDSAEYLSSGDTWTPDDQHIATTAAIEARVVTLVDEVGGFVPIANHTSFPTSNPDINDDAGTVVSIQSVSGLTHLSGASTNATTTGATAVTITGIPASLPSPAGAVGMLVVSTGTLNTYTFHRLTPEVTDVVNVANNAANITTVAGIDTEVTTVAGITGNVTTVAGISGNVTTVAGISSSIPTVAGISSAVTTVAGIDTNITTVATNTSNINTNATNIVDINTVASISGDVATVATNNANVTTVATNIANVNTVVSNATNINTVAGNISNVNTVASISNAVTTVADNDADVTTCATNIAAILDAPTQAANAATSAASAANSAIALLALQYLADWGLITDAAGTTSDYGALV